MSTIGHNQGQEPQDEFAALLAGLQQTYARWQADVAGVVSGVAALPEEVTSETQNGQFADFARKVRTLHQDLEAQRVAEKKIYDRRAAVVHGFFSGMLEKLTSALSTITTRQGLWMERKRAEERRIRLEQQQRAEQEERQRRQEAEAAAAAAAEAAERAAELKRQAEQQQQPAKGRKGKSKAVVPPPPPPSAEEIARAEKQAVDAEINAVLARDEAKLAEADAEHRRARAAAKPGDLHRTRSQYGVLTTAREDWTFSELDRQTLDLETLRQHLPVGGLETALRAYIAAGGRQIKGAKIYRVVTTVNR